jgi:hypothetical protein
MQGACNARAIEADADSLDALIGAQPEDDDRPHAAGFLRHVGQRVVLRDGERSDLKARDFHSRSSCVRASKPGSAT